MELIDGLEDPTTEEAFAADRVVAAAARKAIALTRALNAADPSYVVCCGWVQGNECVVAHLYVYAVDCCSTFVYMHTTGLHSRRLGKTQESFQNPAMTSSRLWTAAVYAQTM